MDNLPLPITQIMTRLLKLLAALHSKVNKVLWLRLKIMACNNVILVKQPNRRDITLVQILNW